MKRDKGGGERRERERERCNQEVFINNGDEASAIKLFSLEGK